MFKKKVSSEIPGKSETFKLFCMENIHKNIIIFMLIRKNILRKIILYFKSAF